MTGTIRAARRPAAPQDAPVLRLWISSAVSRFGNPFGFIAVIAATKEEAITKAQARIKAEAAVGGVHVPAQRYAQNLLDHLETGMTEMPEGVAIDWTPADKPRKS
jgi:hypothetical protein